MSGKWCVWVHSVCPVMEAVDLGVFIELVMFIEAQ